MALETLEVMCGGCERENRWEELDAARESQAQWNGRLLTHGKATQDVVFSHGIREMGAADLRSGVTVQDRSSSSLQHQMGLILCRETEIYVEGSGSTNDSGSQASISAGVEHNDENISAYGEASVSTDSQGNTSGEISVGISVKL